jgi:multicomponent Na+:H+ antiporter subunit C
VSTYIYGVAGWLVLVGSFAIVRSRNLIHAVVCLSVAQSGTYLLLLAVGYQQGGAPPIFLDAPASTPVVDPVVQAMTLTDIVIQATVTALLLALAIQVHKRHHTLDPDQLSALRG